MIDNIIDDDIELSSNTGKYVLFCVPHAPNDEIYKFSSILDNIGKTWDCSLKNNTKVWILSEPTEAIHPTAGTVIVVKIMGPQSSMWVRTDQLKEINEKENN